MNIGSWNGVWTPEMLIQLQILAAKGKGLQQITTTLAVMNGPSQPHIVAARARMLGIRVWGPIPGDKS